MVVFFFTPEQQHPQHTAKTHTWCTFRQDSFGTQANCFTRTLAVGDPASGTAFKTSETREGAAERTGEQENGTEKKGEGQFELEFGQPSNVFAGCLHGLIKSAPLARGLVATRGGLWCLCHGFPAGQPHAGPTLHPPQPPSPSLLPAYCWLGVVT